MTYTDEEPAPYNVRDEGAPAHRFFSADFQRTLQDGVRIAKEAVAAVKTLDGFADENLQKLLMDSEKLRAFQGSDTKTIAVLGDSGEGKGFTPDS